MKKSSGFFRGMLDGLRSTVSQPSSGSKSELEVDESLKSDNFKVAKIVRHGFPYQPTALAFDPIQRLIAIGTKNGSLRILGRPGVDIHVQHIPEYAVLQIIFIINEGSLITLCADDSLHLWNLRSKPPQILHSLKFQKDRITCCHLSFQSKWLYIGTERGNVHVVNIDSFMLSGYVINWNKAIELSRKTHPGSVVHLSDCPIDSNKLLLGYESGCIVLWDLRNKSADFRHNYSECLKSISWHHEGRQFICSHSDGSLTTWNIKGVSKPVSVVYPHSKSANDLKPESCKPIYKTEWRTVRNGDSYIIFSGGLPHQSSQPTSTSNQASQPSQSTQSTQSTQSSSSQSPLNVKLDKVNGTQSLTVIHGKTTTVLEMEHNIIDFITLCESPYETDFSDPYAIVVLLFNDLVVVDLLSPGYPCFQNPYSMDLHESPVTYCYYLADCPTDLVHAFFSVGHKGTKRSGFSSKEWPISGGEWGSSTVSYPEIIITGHADGSIKFWDASSVHLQVLYKLKTAKLFEKPKIHNKTSGDSSQQENCLLENDDPFAIEQMAFCTDSRYLCVGGASSQVIVFRFSKHEAHTEVPVIEITMNYDNDTECESGDNEASGVTSYLTQASNESHSHEIFHSLQVKSGHHKRLPGFQAEFVCLSPWIDRTTPPFRITSLCVNSYARLLAYGSENSLVIIDMIQKCAVLNVSTPNLYGAADPYQRIIRSTKKSASTGVNKDNTDGNQSDADRCKSPTSEQSEECRSTETSVPNTPILQKLFDIPIVPIPPPRTKRKQNIETTVKEHQNSSENSSSINADIINTNIIEINSDQSVVFTKCEPNVRPNELNLIRKNSQNSNSIKDGSHSTTSVDSDDQSPQSCTVSSSLPSPTDNCELNDKSLSKVNICSNNNNTKFAVNDKALHNNYYKKKKFKIIDLRPGDKDDSMVSRIISKQQQQQQSSSSGNASVKKQITPEMKRSRSQGTRHKLQKMHTIQSMASADEGLINYNFGSGSDKIDSSFSRSRSSSISSLENITIESVQYIAFADTFCTKSDATTSPCLWVGTSLGSVLVISLTLPDSTDNRILCLQTVIASPSGSIYRLKGSILCISFMDFTGTLLQLNSETWKDSNKADNTTPSSSSSSADNKRTGSLTITRTGSGGGSITAANRSKISPTSSSADMRDSQFVVMVSEKQIRLINLPSQLCSYKATLTETSFAVRADVVYIKSADSVCLAAYLGTGNIVVYSLPSLRLLIDIDFLALTDVRIARTICFSANGHGMYLSSPSELTKFTISQSFCDNIPDMVGALFTTAKELPEAPKPSFLKGLFGVGTSSLDREELFNESNSGKPSKTIARHIPGSLDHMKAQTGTFGAELAKLREGVSERGERLNQLEDKTARMQSESEAFASAAHNVMLKYKDKKWYQF